MKVHKILITMVILLFIPLNASALNVKYTSMGVPNVNSSFKTWMDYRTVKNTRSAQYKFIRKWGWCDGQGFM